MKKQQYWSTQTLLMMEKTILLMRDKLLKGLRDQEKEIFSQFHWEFQEKTQLTLLIFGLSHHTKALHTLDLRMTWLLYSIGKAITVFTAKPFPFFCLLVSEKIDEEYH